MMKRGKDNIVGGIFINYGELHDNYNIQFRRTVDLFQREHIGGDDLPYLL